MGLELLELTLEAEKVFNVRLKDEEVTECVTPRHFIDLVWSKLAVAKPPTCPSQHAFHQIRQAIVKVLNLPRRRVRPSTPIQDVLPSKSNKRKWRELRQALGPVSRPPNHQPLLPSCAKAVAFAIFGGVLCRYLDIVPRDWAATYWATVAGAVVLAIVLVAWTHRWRNEIRSSRGTLRDLIPHPLPATYVSRDQVAERFKAICMEELGLGEEHYKEDANFVRDWNCG
jgi:hypothetical protein